MPGGDGRGPRVGSGKGGGRRAGRGQGGPSYCRCQRCGYRTQHARGRPCNRQTCPRCGTRLTRG
ncbi:MAG: hypothetical protein GF416_09330 [Candidatus Altiarchaeales archaeon]|nr:hypothetical protein [Candidatus Altiarchaeales archaeon]